MARSAHDISDATLRLLMVPGIGPATMRKLSERFDSHEEIVNASVAALMQVPGIGRESAESLKRGMESMDIDAEREALLARDVTVIVHGDADYPPLLASIPDPPPALWVRGSIVNADRLAIAIVGSRRCSPYGREQAGRFAALLAQSGLTIISGGAVGIDGEAHRGALRVNGRTIAVMGCGLSECYPPQHKELFDRIVESEAGAVISEHPMATPPRATNFPARNRIISGLSLGVLVIEAARRSGALITARAAAEQHGREVMALPGRVDSPASAGCLQAIREGWAALVRDHADVLAQLDSSSQLLRGALEAAGHVDAATSATLFDANLTDGQRAIVDALIEAGEPLVVDQLAARTRLPLSQIQSDITLLQIRGRITRDQRGITARTR